ncbi:MAG: PIN domain-containing protein [Treponema sp.]|nr:PIN domain-containing protein [Treponema sp.]
MDTFRFMLDSNVVIDTLNDDLVFAAFLADFPNCEVYINPVVAIEVLAKAGMSEDTEAAARALLDSFKWVEIDKAVCEVAVQIRRAKELRLPDALIAASAIILNATVLSNDSHLRDYQRSGYTARATR